MIAWIALGLSAGVAAYNVWRDFVHRRFVEWKVMTGGTPDVPDAAVTWMWIITNVGDEPAYDPRLAVRRREGIWEQVAGGPPKLEPNEPWSANLNAKIADPTIYTDQIRISFGTGRRRKISTHAGRRQVEVVLPRSQPRRKFRLRLEERPPA